MANQNFKIDITGWEKKVKNVLEVQARIVQEVVTWGLEQVRDATIKNVSGPRFSLKEREKPEVKSYISSMVRAGKLPVNVMFGFLRRSIKIIHISTVLGAVYSDHTVANYNRAVHFGTRKMRPRPFLQAAVDERRPAILNRMKYEIMKEINKVGRA